MHLLRRLPAPVGEQEQGVASQPTHRGLTHLSSRLCGARSQGNPAIVDTLQRHLASRGRCVTTMLLSEITPTKLAAMAPSFDAWVQVACPRLSIDWGEGFG